jgi:hypothetical protein
MEIRVSKKGILAVSLIAIGIALRVLPHTANFAPVGAIALFAGAILAWRVALWLPLAIMVLSDLLIGLHPLVWFTWGSFVLITLLGRSLRNQSNWVRVPVGAAASSLIFFAVSNFGVWLEGRLYAHTWQGLVDCYVMALPFLRPTLTSDVAFSIFFFGAYALVSPAFTGYFRLRLPARGKDTDARLRTADLD